MSRKRKQTGYASGQGPQKRYGLLRPPAGWGGKVWGVTDFRTGLTLVDDQHEEVARLLVAALNAYETQTPPARPRVRLLEDGEDDDPGDDADPNPRSIFDDPMAVGS